MSGLRPRSRELLEAARLERTPSDADRERVFQALVAGTALAAVASTASASASASLVSKLTGGVTKWWLLGGLSVAVAGGVYLDRPPPAEGPSPASVASPPKPPSLPDRTAHRAESEPAVAQPVAEEPKAPGPGLEKPLSLGHAKAAPSDASAAREIARPSLQEELVLLRDAHTAYRSVRAQQALRLIAEHQRRFPRSQLGHERAVLEVLALCATGQTRSAQRLAAKLRAGASSSATLAGLEHSCAAAEK